MSPYYDINQKKLVIYLVSGNLSEAHGLILLPGFRKTVDLISRIHSFYGADKPILKIDRVNCRSTNESQWPSKNRRHKVINELNLDQSINHNADLFLGQ